MPADSTPDQPEQPSQPQGGRHRRRRNVVGGSPHREEYERLLRAGWSSLALERYALHRYGEDIPASTFRTYKKRKGIEAPQSFGLDEVEAVDVLSSRAELIRLQKERIGIDVEHERSMGKLFGSTAREIEVLGRLLTEHKVDLQDVGLLPRAGEEITVHRTGPQESDEVLPKSRSLSEALGIDPSQEIDAARALHLRLVGDAQ